MKSTMTIVVLAIFGVTLCAQENIELDHTIPALKISRNNDPGIELGYYSDGIGTSGYVLDLKNVSTDDDAILIYGGDQANEATITMHNAFGNPSLRFIGGGYGAGQNLGRVITDQLEIKAGSDLAEYFDATSDQITPGQIVSIDAKAAGMITHSESAYDRKVIGIVSGANGLSTGMFMGQQGSLAHGAHPIALTGRAYVYATAENGDIKPGDFLTSSSTPGYAMKVKKMRKAKGAIIGKAMSSMDENGFVLVLINLQ